MNFLAHLALSGNNSEVMVGNFIGDFVKGKAYDQYSPLVKEGILLHRAIDDFTDHHPATKACAQLLSDGYGRYAGIVVDVFYDHFLSANWGRIYHAPSLTSFVNNAHKTLIRHYFMLPAEVKYFLPFLINSRRLENYQYFESLKKSLEIMSRRTSLPSESEYAIETLKANYQEFESLFFLFYGDIHQHLKQHKSIMNG